MIRKLIYILSIAFVIVSCEDAFETTLEIDLPDPPQLLQFSSFITEGDETKICQVGSVLPIDANVSSEYLIEGATVKLTSLEREESIDFDFIGTDNTIVNFTKDIDEEWLIKGETYEMEINHSAYPTATATQILPFQTEILNVRFLEDAGLDTDGDESSGVEFTFLDKTGKNFYEVFLYLVNPDFPEIVLSNNIYINSTDPSLTYGYNEISMLVEDDLFEGEEKTILLKFSEFYASEKEQLYIVFRTISEDHYRFSKTAKLADEAEDNPFQTPVQVHSNAVNGVGIFSMYSEVGQFVL